MRGRVGGRVARSPCAAARGAGAKYGCRLRVAQTTVCARRKGSGLSVVRDSCCARTPWLQLNTSMSELPGALVQGSSSVVAYRL